MNTILGIPISFDPHVDDSLVWPLRTSSLVTVKSAYSFFASLHSANVVLTLNNIIDYTAKRKYVWNLNCTSKVRYLIWALLRNKLPPGIIYPSNFGEYL